MAPLLHLLLLVLAFVASSTASEAPQKPDLFLNINCGGSDNFTEENNLTWVSDEGYVRGGQSATVRSPTNTTEQSTLRAFKSRLKKSCYTIPVLRDVKILVRVTFYYGNYDGLETPPEFVILFDGNLWRTVTTTMDNSGDYEVVYVTKKSNTSICFAKTVPNQNPFVSTIEVRTLADNMYIADDKGKALQLYGRFAYGADNTIRFPNDKYDRIWHPESEGYTVVKSDTTVRVENDAKDDPPSSLFVSAIAPPNGTHNLSISTPYLPSDLERVYCNFYFSEMSNLNNTGDIRSFNCHLNGHLISTLIEPPYQNVWVTYSSKGGISASNESVFDFTPTSNSTLPPIISAFEIFTIQDASDGTYDSDVGALLTLQERFEVLQDWTGDPCLPKDYNWEWVRCYYFTSPRISQLNLSGYGLSGTLPDFSPLDSLETIDLHNNSLSGDIPEFLSKLPNLKLLNLADNNFKGIPKSLSNNKTIKINVSGNPLLDTASVPDTTNRESKVAAPTSLQFYLISFFAIVAILY